MTKQCPRRRVASSSQVEKDDEIPPKIHKPEWKNINTRSVIADDTHQNHLEERECFEQMECCDICEECHQRQRPEIGQELDQIKLNPRIFGVFLATLLTIGFIYCASKSKQ